MSRPHTSFRTHLVVGITAACLVLHGAAQSNVVDGFSPPQKPSPNAYSRLWMSSPFTEKVVVTQEQGPGFADSLRLEGVITLDGEDVACLTNTETEEVLYLRKSQPVNGISLVAIENRQHLDQTKVVLSAGGQRSAVGFADDQMVVTPSAAAKATKATDQKQQNKPPQQKPETQERKTEGEKTKLTEQEMLERRRKFWESMRDRRRRGGGK